MAQAYQFKFVDAPIDLVWRAVFQQAEQRGSILTMQEPKLLVVQSQDACIVYGLRQYPAMEHKTGVYLVLTQDTAAATDLINAPDLFKTLETMPVNAAPDIYEGAQAQLEQIKSLAEAADQKLVAVSTGGAQKPSIDPNKSGPERLPAPPFGQGVPVVKLGVVWLAFFIVGGLFSAALLLALNWWSLGKPRKALSTLVASIVVMTVLDVLVMIVYVRVNSADESLLLIAGLMQFGVSIIVTLWQEMQQKPTYQQSVERYGKPAGWNAKGLLLSCAAVALGLIIGLNWPAVFNSIVFGTSAALTSVSPHQSYDDARITVSYPAHWGATDWFDEFCASDVDCIVTVGEPIGGGSLMVLEIKNFFGLFVTLDGVSEYAANDLTSGFENLHDVTQLKFQIDGRDAIRHQFYYTTEVGTGRQTIDQAMVGNVVLIRDGGDLVRLDSYAPAQLSGVVDTIINSLHFVTPLEK